MDPVTIAIVTLSLLFILILSGVHLSTSLMFTSLVGVFLVTGRISTSLNVLSQSAWGAIRQYMFGVIPLFVLMGMFANLSGASQELYDSANIIFKRLKVRGGVLIATIIANAIFAAITGVTIASAAVFTQIAYPQMVRLKYDKRVAVGCIAGSAILGMLIPPSLLMIVYGSQADVSIGKLFLAGFLPGIIMTLAFIIVVIITAKKHPEYIPEAETLTEDERQNFWKIVLRPWAMFVLILVSLGGIWLGFFTPTEAGGIGAFGGFLIVLIKGKLNFKDFKDTLITTATTTGSVLILLVSASAYSKTLAMGGVINLISNLIGGLNVAPIVVIFIFMLILIILGCVLDSTSILLLTIPLMVPVIRDLGYDPVWFGIVMIIATECGLLTPPFGMNVFTVKATLHGMPDGKDVTVEDIFSGSNPYLIAMIAVLIICIFIPQIVTLLPSTMS